MKITRVLTYNIDEDYIRNFFDESWWEDKEHIDEDELDYLIDDLRDESYNNEEIIYEEGVKERITQIWQEECDNYRHKTDEEKQKETEEEILEEIQYYKNRIALLEDKIKNMKGE